MCVCVCVFAQVSGIPDLPMRNIRILTYPEKKKGRKREVKGAEGGGGLGGGVQRRGRKRNRLN